MKWFRTSGYDSNNELEYSHWRKPSKAQAAGKSLIAIKGHWDLQSHCPFENILL